MALVTVEHSVRLASPSEAEAFFRALGFFRAPRIAVSVSPSADFKRIVRLVHAIEPGRDETIRFEHGALAADARAALQRLASFNYRHLHVKTPDTELRIWPGSRSRVHSRTPFPRAFVDGTVHHGALGFDLETPAIATAMLAFFDVAEELVTAGSITGIKGETKPPLLDFLRVLNARVEGLLEVDVASARALTSADEHVVWRAEHVEVEFPAGVIRALLTSLHMDEDGAKALLWIDKVLAKAGIRHS